MKNHFSKTSFSSLFLFLVSFCLFSAASPALAAPQDQPESPSLLAQRVQTRYRQVKSLSADYQRASSFVSLGAPERRSPGCRARAAWSGRRPLKLRLEQDTPRRELIITGGDAAWWVRPQRKQADLYPLNQFTSGLTSLLDALGGLARLEKDYKVQPRPR